MPWTTYPGHFPWRKNPESLVMFAAVPAFLILIKVPISQPCFLFFVPEARHGEQAQDRSIQRGVRLLP